jgi:hypothetical protein
MKEIGKETMKRIVFSFVALFVFGALTLPAAPKPPSASQAGQPDATTVSGKLTTKAGKFYVTDQTTHAATEIRGEGLAQWVGKNVQITGRVMRASLRFLRRPR